MCVCSNPAAADRRQAIRETWSDKDMFTKQGFHVVFVVGVSKDPSLNKLMQDEYDKYGDILQLDVIEDYSNLTRKGLANMRWVVNKCSKNMFFLKIDDDFFLNTFTLLDRLHNMIEIKYIACIFILLLTLPCIIIVYTTV